MKESLIEEFVYCLVRLQVLIPINYWVPGLGKHFHWIKLLFNGVYVSIQHLME